MVQGSLILYDGLMGETLCMRCGCALLRDHESGRCLECRQLLLKELERAYQRDNYHRRVEDRRLRLAEGAPEPQAGRCVLCAKLLRFGNKSGYCALCCKRSAKVRAAEARRLAAKLAMSREAKVHHRLIGAKARAKKLGIPFAVTIVDLQPLPERCPIFSSIRLDYYAVGAIRDESASIDRINPVLGYVPGNVAVISYRANRLKSDATPEELMAVALYARGGSLGGQR